MKIGLKWVHMARYELILRLERALWLRIIFKPLLTPKGTIKLQKSQKSLKVRAKPAKTMWRDMEGHRICQLVASMCAPSKTDARLNRELMTS